MLDRILHIDNLTDAWLRVEENRGAPGVDEISVRRFARNWEENLRRIRDQVRAGTYRPARLRRVAVPKGGGGQRLLSIPIVADRVLMRAALNIVDDRFDRQFLPCSFGYRRGRGLRQAVAALLAHRDRGLRWVLDADIDDCFASLDHALLERFLAETLPDPQVLALMRAWMLMTTRRPSTLHPPRSTLQPPTSNLQPPTSNPQPPKGIALGMPISPLWCNVYLHRLDVEMARGRWAVVRYADDFVVCCGGPRQAAQAQQVVADVLDSLRLRLEPAKTRVTSFDEGFDFLGVRFYRETYTFLWQGKEIEVSGPVPEWLWGYMPEGYGA